MLLRDSTAKFADSTLIVSLRDPAEYGSGICQACDGGMKLILTLLSATLMVNPTKRVPGTVSSSMGRP